MNKPSILGTPSTYKIFYWGPMLFKTNLGSEDIKACAKLCSKKSSVVSDTLAGVIKHQHYISTNALYKIISPYLPAFREAHRQWYGQPLTKSIRAVMAWVNFMGPGEFNPPHVHENCDFSSVLFVKIPKKHQEEHKKFPGTGGGPGSISFTYGEMRPFTINHRNFLPQEGDLFIFPAGLTHFVYPFTSDDERISISVNFKFD